MPPRQNILLFMTFASILIFIRVFVVVIAVSLKEDSSAKEAKNNFQANFNYTGAISSNGIGCADIGRDVLLEGGSAVDSIISVLFCEGVILPQSMGIGGGLFMTIYEKSSGKVYTINARPAAPLAATENMFVNNTAASSRGGLSVATPGEIKGYWEAHKRFGKLPWRRLIEPTIKLCLDGHIVSSNLANVMEIRKQIIFEEPSLSEIFVNPKTNDTWKAGDIIKRTQLGKTLQIIAAEGADALHSRTGSLMKSFVKDIQDFGGIITEEDMIKYNVEWNEPIVAELKENRTLYTTDLPSNGVILSFILQILDGYSEHDESPKSIHRMIEAFKYAYAKRSLLGDRQFVRGIEEVMYNMTSTAYTDYIRSLIDDTRTFNDYEHYGANFSFADSHGTAHMSVLAPNGDAVAATSTINLYFGAKIRSPSTGIILNDLMDDFSTPGTINEFGVPASPANYIVPLKRPLSSMCPTIILDSDRNPMMVIGAAGGTRIPTAVAQNILQVLYTNRTLADAMNRRVRIHHQLAPMQVEYEAEVEQSVLEELKKLGHKLNPSGGGTLTAVLRKDGEIFAAFDPRSGGSVAFL